MDELATASGSGDGDISTSSLQTKLTLDLRGTRFNIERETLMNLPESVLLCLFPNGLVLSRQGAGTHYEDDSEADDDEEEVYLVDVSLRVESAPNGGSLGCCLCRLE